MQTVMQDVRFALRALRTHRGFTTVALLTLAVGLGANTAMFSIVDAVLLRPLPYPSPAQLVTLQEQTTRDGHAAPVSTPNFRDWRAHARSFSALAAYAAGPSAIVGGDAPTRATAASVSRGFFAALGVSPALGRTFTDDEHQFGAAPAAVVSDRLWRERLGGTRDVLGKRVQVDGFTLTIVGVMPPGFAFPDDADLWSPSELLADESGRTAHNWEVIGRLRPGVTIAQARHEMSAIAARLHATYGSDDDALDVRVTGLHERLAGPVRGRLLLLMGAVTCILLIICLNLASALLARDRSRAKELAIRTALGADRGRLARQLVTESLLLALAGGVAGLWVARLAAGAVIAFIPGGLPGVQHLALDARVALFTLAASLATGILFGLAPALRAAGADPQHTLAHVGGRGATRAGGRARGILVIGEVALAVVLLTGAGLLLRSLARLLAVDPGFARTGVVTADVYPPPSKYLTPTASRLYVDRVIAEVGTLPGVVAAGAINDAPLGSSFANGGFALDRDGATGYAEYRVVDGDYFGAMRIRTLRGRTFTSADAPGGATAVVISQSLAQAYWPGEDPLGRRMRFFGMDSRSDPWLTVVGVVADVRDRSLAAKPSPTAYVFAPQMPLRTRYGMTVLARTTGSADALIPSVRARIHAVDPDVPAELSTIEQIVSRSSVDRRFTAALLATFAGVAVLLAAIGLYAVLAFGVAERRREMGIRMALGAQRGAVRRMIVGEGLGLTLAGIVAGGVLSLGATRLLGSLLYGVAPTDVPTYAGVSLLLVLVALAASYLPAYRATRVDPLIALRAE
jgi:putative ABC transport system permease protein